LSASRWVFAFPGLQPVEPAATRDLRRTCPGAERVVIACDEVVRCEVGLSILPLWRGERDAVVLDCRLCYPLALAHQIALVECLADQGITPSAAVGLSAGEPAAAYAAGMLGLEDAMRIAAHTGWGVEKHQRWQRIASLHAASSVVDALLDDDRAEVDIALIISNRLTVVSGEKDAIERLLERAARAGVGRTQVPFTFGAHNRHMDAMREPLITALRGLRPRAASCQLVSAATGGWIEEPAQLGPDHWWHHASARIRLADALNKLWDAGYRHFVEVGPRSLFSAELAQRGAQLCYAADLVRTRMAMAGTS
jgi:acyl transferase domain-containing protein